ncbi:hypothetical protein ScPMuIL_014085 [Solemya velum]
MAQWIKKLSAVGLLLLTGRLIMLFTTTSVENKTRLIAKSTSTNNGGTSDRKSGIGQTRMYSGVKGMYKDTVERKTPIITKNTSTNNGGTSDRKFKIGQTRMYSGLKGMLKETVTGVTPASLITSKTKMNDYRQREKGYRERLKNNKNDSTEKNKGEKLHALERMCTKRGARLAKIFLRFAMYRGLNVALSKVTAEATYHYLGFNRSIDVTRLIPTPRGQEYHILCSHVVYNRTVFREVMPKEAPYIGIVRDPLTHFVSSGTYYAFFGELVKYSGLNVQESVIDFIGNREKYKKVSTFWVHNRMAGDFGLLPVDFNNATAIDNMIRGLNEDFRLIMVMERFHESLVLMKRYLCWELKDILFIERNVHENITPELRLTDNIRDWLKKWNVADFKLYQFFQEKFSKLVEQEGGHFQGEVAHFMLVNRMVKSFCTDSRGTNLVVGRSEWNDQFSVTPGNCSYMMETEIPFLTRMKNLQFRKLWQAGYNNPLH